MAPCAPRTAPRAVLTEPVLAWRRRALARAGFPPDLAAALAQSDTADLHALLTLVESGCPATLAARILSPDEGPDD